MTPAVDKAYVVGGAVRDRLLGLEPGDLDLVVVGDPEELASELGATAVLAHDRFGTSVHELDGVRIDVARARTETYAEPGALPTVAPAASIEEDLVRRDFSVNAIAVPYREWEAAEPELVDPLGGREDLERRRLRVLHEASFRDDPTRAIRAARYAARLGFEPEPETERLLRATDLDSVSAERREAELLRLAAEASAPRGFALLAEWGLVELREGGVELAEKVGALLGAEPWRGSCERGPVVLAAALGPVGAEVELAGMEPSRPSEIVAAARGRSPRELVPARALGAEWLDRYPALGEVRLGIDGNDLQAEGVAPGPALGRGLEAALRAKLDGEAPTRERELQIALAVARES